MSTTSSIIQIALVLAAGGVGLGVFWYARRAH